MGMLVSDGSIMDPSINKRRRKTGVIVQHPLDILDNLKEEDNKRLYSITTDLNCVEQENNDKTNWLKRSSWSRPGSLRSSVVSRKSSAKSLRSTSTIKTTASASIRKNSGNFDGWNIRKKSIDRKTSIKSQHKISVSAQRDEILAAFYRNIEEVDDDTSSCSSSDSEEEKSGKINKQKINLKEVSHHTRTEEYVIKHAIDTSDVSDEGFFQNNKPIKKNSLVAKKTSIRQEEKEDQLIKSEIHSIKPDKLNRVSRSSAYTNHSEINYKRLNELIFDENSNLTNKFDSLPKQKVNRTKSLPVRKPRSHLYNPVLQLHDDFRKDIPMIHEDIKFELKKSKKNISDSEMSCSTDSACGSTHSISTVSSDSIFQSPRMKTHRTSVPMNFIPGLTSPTTGRPRNKSLPVSLTYFRKASFCFKGVTCRIFQNTPRTYRALAHAGCIGLVIPAPATHKCKH